MRHVKIVFIMLVAVFAWANSASAGLEETKSLPGYGDVQQMIRFAFNEGWKNNQTAILAVKQRLENAAPSRRPFVSVAARNQAREANTRGLQALNNQQLAEAINEFQKAANNNPADVELLNNFGYAFLLAQNYAAAEYWMIRALVLSPKRTNAWVNLGTVYAENGGAKEAVACYSLGYWFSQSPVATRNFFGSSLFSVELRFRAKQ